MTLERTSRPLDFLVSRFSRLYPAYWAAALLAFATGLLVPELGSTVTASQAAGNALMFHNLLGIPHVDGVFWTLEVELLFYWAMFLSWLTMGFANPHRWIAVWLALSIAVAAGEQLGVHVPYIVSRVLILQFFPYFSLGVLLYLYFVRKSFRWAVDGLLAGAALLAIGLIDSPGRILSTCAFLLLFPLVTFRWSSTAVVRALARVGTISYPLYLVHETAGWALIRRLEASGVETNLAIATAIVVAFVLAYALHVAIEKPAMNAIRQAWVGRARTTEAEVPNRSKWVVGTVLLGLVILVGNRLTLHA